MPLLHQLLGAAAATAIDLFPILAVVAAFQGLVLRRRPPRLGVVLSGIAHVFLGLTLFRFGIETSLLPVGSLMAEQLVVSAGSGGAGGIRPYLWLVAFAALLGFAATLVEPTLTAVAERVRVVSGGVVRAWDLRVMVAVGLGLGLALGTLRIILGLNLNVMVGAVLAIAAVLAFRAPRSILPLALDVGAMATSVVTVPLIAAFGIAAATHIPGRDPLTDGFGLIILALTMPIVSVLAIVRWRLAMGRRGHSGGD